MQTIITQDNMQTINRQALAERIHAKAVAKGFWPTNEEKMRYNESRPPLHGKEY